MVVVSDTSPMSALVQIGRLDILPSLFGQVVVPPPVLVELQALVEFGIDVEQFGKASWLLVQPASPSPLLDSLLTNLDPGEAHAIALSVELKADLLIVDERKGRRAAASLNLPFTGVGGVLIRAKQVGLITSVQQVLSEIEDKAGFFLSEMARMQILTAAGE